MKGMHKEPIANKGPGPKVHGKVEKEGGMAVWVWEGAWLSGDLSGQLRVSILV